MSATPFIEENTSLQPVRTLEDLQNRILKYHPTADLAFIEKAYKFSESAHEGQFRRSGEPYFSHPLSVAGILADLNMDLDTIATGLLHDTVEDTHATLEDIRREFGDSVAQLVDGVTKISQMKFRNSLEKQGENIRKMIVAMGKDVRVILVKLADRLHNMRTLNFMPFEKQEKIALETLEIYCPLAGRMGINTLKIELEDLCFRYYRPDKYYEMVQKVRKSETETNRYIGDVISMIQRELSKAHFSGEVYGRAKHLWSIYRKMTSRNIDYEQIHDVLAFRVIMSSVGECYAALGLVHSLWKPIPGRFKDFIAMPKANNYQSLHTTVVGPGGDRIEIQIRTKDMHQIAERGIAAHWKYKERGKVVDSDLQDANWLRDLVNLHQQVRNADEFLDTIKTDLFETEIYVFTPNGDVKEFPEGATPIDFAYSVHTQLGHTCVGARVNGKMVPIKYQLQNGDTVEIVTSKTQNPSKDWLKFAVTNKARTKIRAWVKEEQRKRAIALGKDLVEKEFRKFGMAANKYLKGELFEDFVKAEGVHGLDELYIKIGYGKLETRHLVTKLVPENVAKNEAKSDDVSFMEKIAKAAVVKSRKSNSLISVDGMDDVLVHYARCCNPIPGDPITGFISRGRGITIHRSDCSKAFEFDSERKVDVAWNVKTAETGQERTVKVKVIAHDIPGLLKSMSEVFAVQMINIQSVQIRTTKDKKAVCHFEVSVRDASHLNNAIFELQKIKGIIGVSRVTQ